MSSGSWMWRMRQVRIIMEWNASLDFTGDQAVLKKLRVQLVVIGNALVMILSECNYSWPGDIYSVWAADGEGFFIAFCSQFKGRVMNVEIQSSLVYLFMYSLIFITWLSINDLQCLQSLHLFTTTKRSIALLDNQNSRWYIVVHRLVQSSNRSILLPDDQHSGI